MCDPLNLNIIPVMTLDAARCICGEPLDHEDEAQAGTCWNCQAAAAGFTMPIPTHPHLLTRAEADRLCGVTHRRKAS